MPQQEKMKTKCAIVCVTNDLSNDRRVDNTCSVLTSLGFEVTLVGRKRKGSIALKPRKYATFRMRLWFDKGFLFYAEINMRLFFFLLVRRAGLIVANDLDTLWPAHLAAKLKSSDLVYDTHEFFTGVPELVERPRVQKVWTRIEQRIFPHLKYVITVNDSIADLYRELYNKTLIVIRNVPPLRDTATDGRKAALGIPEDKKVILLQGAWINKDRGGEEAVEAMAFIENAVLLVIGGGDVIHVLKEIAEKPGIKGKVIFKDRLPFEELCQYTAIADIGLSIDKDTNINYRFSLPNKLFDYIHAGVPVLASPLVEVSKIVSGYKVGELITSHNPESIAGSMLQMINNEEQLRHYKANCIKARTELCWDRERKIAEELYRRFL